GRFLPSKALALVEEADDFEVSRIAEGGTHPAGELPRCLSRSGTQASAGGGGQEAPGSPRGPPPAQLGPPAAPPPPPRPPLRPPRARPQRLRPARKTRGSHGGPRTPSPASGLHGPRRGRRPGLRCRSR